MKKKNSYITLTDQFCGAGGSSIGATMAGAEVRLAMNHWQLAIDTHNTNFPKVDHDCTDISAVNPRRYPSTDFLITSPECTNHSLAKGKARRFYEKDLFGNILIDASEERSRATMWDVPRFAEYHDYNIIVTENVVDAAKWRMWDAWLAAMHALGYDHEVVYFNSMFAWPTPQSRDRLYVVFWKKGNRKPDLEFRPIARCSTCAKDVESIQTWKSRKKWGRYKAQYFYRCPDCHAQITPYYYAAVNAIDWSIQAERIGDRKRPLKPKTLARVQYGLDAYGGGANPKYMGVPLNDPTGAITTWDHHALIGIPANLQKKISVAAPGFIAELHGTSKAAGLGEALMCMTTGGGHHALLSSKSFLSYYYGTQQASGMAEPIHTMTSLDRAALVQALDSLTIDDLYFRMLQPPEIGKAMAFPVQYVVLGTNRDKVKQYGNAVTPPVMQMLIKRCMATFQ